MLSSKPSRCTRSLGYSSPRQLQSRRSVYSTALHTPHAPSGRHTQLFTLPGSGYAHTNDRCVENQTRKISPRKNPHQRRDEKRRKGALRFAVGFVYNISISINQIINIPPLKDSSVRLGHSKSGISVPMHRIPKPGWTAEARPSRLA